MNRQTADNITSDAELVRRAQGGDAQAFAELVSRYQDRVFNTCYRLCHNHSDALDLTQTTFLKALEALPRFEARSSFYTWLFRIAVNAAFSERRARLRRPTVSLDDPGPGGDPRASTAAASDDAAEVISRRETYSQIEVALDSLEPDFRVAVVLKDIENMDYATIAEILEVPVGTIKSRIHRGRLMLRELLTKERTKLDSQSA
ncbi:MAG: sigma-70 family RNA polymerase sigma factor [Planctomycetota bacterium]